MTSSLVGQRAQVSESTQRSRHRGLEMTAYGGPEPWALRMTYGCGHGSNGGLSFNTAEAAFRYGREVIDRCVCSVCGVPITDDTTEAPA